MNSQEIQLVDVSRTVAREIASEATDLEFYIFGHNDMGFRLLVQRGPRGGFKELIETETMYKSRGEATETLRLTLKAIRRHTTLDGTETADLTDELIKRICADLSIDRGPGKPRGAMTFLAPAEA